MGDRHRSRSRSPRRNSERTNDGIQERLKKLSGLENGSIPDKVVEDVLKIDREKVLILALFNSINCFLYFEKRFLS